MNKTFSERWNADWLTSNRLEEILIDFFNDQSIPKTITHMQSYLNQDFVIIEQRKIINDDYRRLLETAELMCEEWVINQGFENDKSFARWYHDKFYGKEKEEIDVNLKVIDPFA